MDSQTICWPNSIYILNSIAKMTAMMTVITHYEIKFEYGGYLCEHKVFIEALLP